MLRGTLPIGVPVLSSAAGKLSGVVALPANAAATASTIFGAGDAATLPPVRTLVFFARLFDFRRIDLDFRQGLRAWRRADFGRAQCYCGRRCGDRNNAAGALGASQRFVRPTMPHATLPSDEYRCPATGSRFTLRRNRNVERIPPKSLEYRQNLHSGKRCRPAPVCRGAQLDADELAPEQALTRE
jgi:hypothetical protein